MGFRSILWRKVTGSSPGGCSEEFPGTITVVVVSAKVTSEAQNCRTPIFDRRMCSLLGRMGVAESFKRKRIVTLQELRAPRVLIQQDFLENDQMEISEGLLRINLFVITYLRHLYNNFLKKCQTRTVYLMNCLSHEIKGFFYYLFDDWRIPNELILTCHLLYERHLAVYPQHFSIPLLPWFEPFTRTLVSLDCICHYISTFGWENLGAWELKQFTLFPRGCPFSKTTSEGLFRRFFSASLNPSLSTPRSYLHKHL